MTRPRPALVILVASAVTLVAVPVGVAAAGSGHDVETAGSRPDWSVTAPAAAALEVPGAMTGRADGGDRPPGARRPAELTSGSASSGGSRIDATQIPRPARIVEPTRLLLPTLDLAAPVDTVGIDDRGQVIVPEDVSRLGWYRFGVAPGADTGSAVVVGHRDGTGQGPGVFYDLGRIDVGDPIIVERGRKEPLRYRVVAREQFGKADIPLDELFGTTGRHRLTLITCGGPFDPNALEYTDNVVVTAVLES